MPWMPWLPWPLPDQIVRSSTQCVQSNYHQTFALGFVIIYYYCCSNVVVALNISFRNCIECLGFGSGPFKKNCTAACTTSITYEMVDQFPIASKQCHQKDTEGCWITFKLEQLVGEDYYKAEILKERGKLLMNYLTLHVWQKTKRKCSLLECSFSGCAIWKHKRRPGVC